MADQTQEVLGELRALRRDYDEIAIGLRLQADRPFLSPWLRTLLVFGAFYVLGYCIAYYLRLWLA